MKLTLKIWRQKNTQASGAFETYSLENISEGSSFLEMLDILSEDLVRQGKEPLAFDYDCREGICGMCSLTINGIPHGPEKGTTACQLHMRHFEDGQTITIEPFQPSLLPCKGFVDRSAFDKIVQSGGHHSTWAVVDANAYQSLKIRLILRWTPLPALVVVPVWRPAKCVAMFYSAKATHMNGCRRGRQKRDVAMAMVSAMDEAGFGGCTNVGECEAVTQIHLDLIAHVAIMPLP